jgi:hypothetical protein
MLLLRLSVKFAPISKSRFLEGLAAAVSLTKRLTFGWTTRAGREPTQHLQYLAIIVEVLAVDTSVVWLVVV